MSRLLLVCAILALAATAQAQTTTTTKATTTKTATKLSPGEMAAVDKDKAEKRAACLKASKEQTPKLGFVARRKFVNACVKR